jgi:DNA replication factor GINS
VLVTRDVDTFVGSDTRDYDLAADDVVTLPATNAEILVQRDAARRL